MPKSLITQKTLGRTNNTVSQAINQDSLTASFHFESKLSTINKQARFQKRNRGRVCRISRQSIQARPRSQPKKPRKVFRIPTWVPETTSSDIIRSFIIDENNRNNEIERNGHKNRSNAHHQSEKNDAELTSTDLFASQKTHQPVRAVEKTLGEQRGSSYGEEEMGTHHHVEITQQIMKKVMELGLDIDFDLGAIIRWMLNMQDKLTVELLESVFGINDECCSVARYACFRIVMSLSESS